MTYARTALALAAAFAVATIASAQPSPQVNRGVAQEKALQAESTAMPQMTAAQTAQYRSEYQLAKAKWASMTPTEQAAVVAAARQKKIADLSAMERYGQNNDMLRETAAQSAELKAQYEAAKEAWAKFTPGQKKAATQKAWQKKRADLDWMERVGQNDDSYLLPE
jgi:predicted Fe-S protein YdhL (DUF1289 family)